MFNIFNIFNKKVVPNDEPIVDLVQENYEQKLESYSKELNIKIRQFKISRIADNISSTKEEHIEFTFNTHMSNKLSDYGYYLRYENQDELINNQKDLEQHSFMGKKTYDKFMLDTFKVKTYEILIDLDILNPVYYSDYKLLKVDLDKRTKVREFNL